MSERGYAGGAYGTLTAGRTDGRGAPPRVQSGMTLDACTDAPLPGLPDDATVADTVAVLKGLADETRLRILSLLRGGEVRVHDLVEALPISQSGVSHQLRVLRGARLVRSRRDGRHIYYRLADEHVAELLDNALSHGAEST